MAQVQKTPQKKQVRPKNVPQEGHAQNPWMLTGILILGALVCGIGLISLIAANWESLSDGAKLAGDFALLAATAVGIVYTWQTQKTWYLEALLLFYLIMCMASIGLISQIYHTTGELYQLLLFWAVITAPAALASHHLFVPMLWACGFLTGCALLPWEISFLKPIFAHNVPWLMDVALLCLAAMVASQYWIRNENFTRAFRAWGLIGVPLVLSFLEMDSVHSVFRHGNALPAYIPGYCFAVLGAWGIWESRHYLKSQKIWMLLTLGIFVLIFHLPLLGVKHEVIYAIYTVVIYGLLAVILASFGARRLFNCFLFLVGCRFVGLYFQAFGGLALTGVGLIVSGLLIIALAALWHKYGRSLAVWSEKVIS